MKIGHTRCPSMLLEPHWATLAVPLLDAFLSDTSTAHPLTPSRLCSYVSFSVMPALTRWPLPLHSTACSLLTCNAYCLFSITLHCILNFLRAGTYVSSLYGVSQATGTAGAK